MGITAGGVPLSEELGSGVALEWNLKMKQRCVVLRAADKVAARQLPREKGGVEEINSRNTNTRLTA